MNAVNTASPATYYVHVDHLNRPVMMTDGAKANVWAAVWQAWDLAHLNDIIAGLKSKPSVSRVDRMFE